MTICMDMQADLKELVKLVRLVEQYAAAVAHGSIQPDQDTKRLHDQRVVRIDEL